MSKQIKRLDQIIYHILKKIKSRENKPKRPANAYLMFKSYLKQTGNFVSTKS